MKIAKLKEDFNVIDDNDFERLNFIIYALKRPIEKRFEREISMIKPLLEQIDFFKNK
jgi:hypothetical protein